LVTGLRWWEKSCDGPNYGATWGRTDRRMASWLTRWLHSGMCRRLSGMLCRGNNTNAERRDTTRQRTGLLRDPRSAEMKAEP
jgi:hypothetical protein